MDNTSYGLLQHQKFVRDRGFDVVFYSIKGSQNYRLETEQSDVDSYFIIMPTLKELALNFRPISTNFSIEGKNGPEYITVKDIRVFFNEVKNYDFCSLEILFSEYLISSYKYYYIGNELKMLDWKSNNKILLYRMYNECDNLCKKINVLNFGVKKDRKTFVRFITDYNFLLNISQGFQSFEVFNKRWRNSLLLIKEGKITKEEALKKFPIFEMRDFIKKEEFIKNFSLSKNINTELNEILLKTFNTKFKEV